MTLDPVVAERLRAGRDAATPVDGYRAPSCRIETAAVAGPHGDVPLRCYLPVGRPAGVLVWAHGGGFRAGDLDMPEADAVARELVARAGVAVASVDYRLAVGGVRFPVPLDDVLAAWHAVTRGLPGLPETGPVFLGGASAGGNLALATALRVRDEGGRLPDGLVLAYPYLHAVMPPASADLTERMAGLPDGARFSPAKMADMAANYLGDDASAVPRYAYPGDDADLGGLPRTLVIGAEYDDLLASAQEAAGRLRQAGVNVEERLEAGVVHGHLNTPGLAAALRSLEAIADFLAEDDGVVQAVGVQSQP